MREFSRIKLFVEKASFSNVTESACRYNIWLLRFRFLLKTNIFIHDYCVSPSYIG